jgi:hypothetical protein
MRISFPVYLASVAALLLASCETNTMPTSAQMDRYFQKAQQLADDRIATLEGQRRRGEITEAEYDLKVEQTRAKVADHATELAWARHESLESRKRAQGIPTGDHPQQVQVPGAGGGESFYRRAGEQGGSSLNNNTPFGGSVFGGPNRGERPELPPVQTPGGREQTAPAPAAQDATPTPVAPSVQNPG